MGEKAFANAFHCNDNRRSQNTERDKDRGERFGFAVTVRMRVVRRSRGKA